VLHAFIPATTRLGAASFAVRGKDRLDLVKQLRAGEQVEKATRVAVCRIAFDLAGLLCQRRSVSLQSGWLLG
jgi:hypothetical protein